MPHDCLNQILASGTSKISHSHPANQKNQWGTTKAKSRSQTKIYIQPASQLPHEKNPWQCNILDHEWYKWSNGESKIMNQSVHQGGWMLVHLAGAGAPSPQYSCLVENQPHIERTMRQLLQTIWRVQGTNKHFKVRQVSRQTKMKKINYATAIEIISKRC